MRGQTGLENQTESALDRAKVGDKPAFAELLREHQSLVFSIAYNFTRNGALAEEIAQDIFLELFRNLNKIDSPAHLLYWLRRSTTNRCIDQSRKLAFRTEVPLNATFDPAASEDRRDTMLSDLVRRQVASLPEWQRAVLILRYQEDLDPTDIAGILNIPLNTVKSRLHRAVETLREKLERKQRVRV